jgi:hypothetical protein
MPRPALVPFASARSVSDTSASAAAAWSSQRTAASMSSGRVNPVRKMSSWAVNLRAAASAAG